MILRSADTFRQSSQPIQSPLQNVHGRFQSSTFIFLGIVRRNSLYIIEKWHVFRRSDREYCSHRYSRQPQFDIVQPTSENRLRSERRGSLWLPWRHDSWRTLDSLRFVISLLTTNLAQESHHHIWNVFSQKALRRLGCYRKYEVEILFSWIEHLFPRT